MRKRIWALFCCGVVSAAHADDFHYDTVRFGQRAMGMGGAVLSFHGEAEAAFYNPAGLSDLHGTLFSGSLHFYGFQESTLRDALDEDQKKRKLSQSGIVTQPASSVISYVFPGGEHFIAYSTFTLSNINRGLSRSVDEKPLSIEDGTTLSYSRTTRDTIWNLGLSYAYRPTDWFAMGITLFGAERTFSMRARSGNVGIDRSYLFSDLTTSVSVYEWEMLARLGFLFQPNENWVVGVTATSTSWNLYSEGSLDSTLLDSGDPASENPDEQGSQRAIIDESGLETRTAYPWNFGLGLSYIIPDLLVLSASSSLYLPSSYRRLHLPGDIEASDAVRAHYTNTVERELVVNANIGFELTFADSWMVRSGFFTNFSATPNIPDSPTRIMHPDIDHMGVTFSIGHTGFLHALNFGTEVQWGQGRAVVPVDATDVNRGFTALDVETVRVGLFVSGAVEFGKAGARRYIIPAIEETIRESQRKSVEPEDEPEDEPGAPNGIDTERYPENTPLP